MADLSSRGAQSDDDLIERLCQEARAAAKNSYSPYSHYRVGAAIYADGIFFSGTNVENISFPATVCAERVAMGAAVSAGHRHGMTALALYAESDSEGFGNTKPLPCGICLQWLAELAPDIDIIVCHEGKTQHFRVSELLARPFK